MDGSDMTMTWNWADRDGPSESGSKHDQWFTINSILLKQLTLSAAEVEACISSGYIGHIELWSDSVVVARVGELDTLSCPHKLSFLAITPYNLA